MANTRLAPPPALSAGPGCRAGRRSSLRASQPNRTSPAPRTLAASAAVELSPRPRPGKPSPRAQLAASSPNRRPGGEERAQAAPANGPAPTVP